MPSRCKRGKCGRFCDGKKNGIITVQWMQQGNGRRCEWKSVRRYYIYRVWCVSTAIPPNIYIHNIASKYIY